MINLIGFVPLMPLIAALIIGLSYVSGDNRGEEGEPVTSYLAVGSLVVSLLLMLMVNFAALTSGAGEYNYGSWFSSGNYNIDVLFYLDATSLILTTLTAIITLVTVKFSVNYMHREAGFQRFFMVMLVFSSAMMLIFSAGSATMLFVGWEMAGVSSYLLIGYAYERENATVNASRAFVTNRIGDAGLLLAIFTLFFWLGNDSWSTMMNEGAALPSLDAGLILLGFLIAAMVKSAVVPFSPWISRALEGPTPSSAIFYGSLMVHAGVYLLLRLEPLLTHVEGMMLLITLIGILTALYGFIVGLTQTDLKSSLIFSTTAQVGLMFIEIGMGWFDLALVHLVAHSIWRSFQFLSSPSLMHLMGRSARPAPVWLRNNRLLFTASLQRFWLDHLSDWIIVKPTKLLSRDMQRFDDKVVNRIIGLPSTLGVTTSLAQFQKQKSGMIGIDGESDIARGSGLLGGIMEWIANVLYWFEEQLVLKGGGEGLVKGIEIIGRYLTKVDYMLSKPRYLMLIIMATFVVIL